MEVIRRAAALMVRSIVLSAQSAAQQRLLCLQQAVGAGEDAGEQARLRDENWRLTSELRLLKDRFGEAPVRQRYTLQGAVPELIYVEQQWSVPPKTAKTVPTNSERRFFPGARITGFRLAA